MKLPKQLFTLLLLIPTWLHANEEVQTNVIQQQLFSKSQQLFSKSQQLIPQELQGQWVIDKDASINFAKKHPDWNDKVAKLFPKMLMIYQKENNELTTNALLLTSGKNKATIPLEFTALTANSYDFIIPHEEGDTSLVITLINSSHINLQSTELFGYQYLLWKRKA